VRSLSPVDSLSTRHAPSIVPSVSNDDWDLSVSDEFIEHAKSIWSESLNLEDFTGTDRRFVSFMKKNSVSVFKPPEIPIELGSFKLTDYQKNILTEQALVGAFGNFASSTAAASAVLKSDIIAKLRSANVSDHLVTEIESMFSECQQTALLDEGLTALASKFNSLTLSRRKYVMKFYPDDGPVFERIPPSLESLFDESKLARVSERLKTSSALKVFRSDPSTSSSSRRGRSNFRGGKRSFWDAPKPQPSSGFRRGSTSRSAPRSDSQRGKSASKTRSSGSGSRSSRPK
jgi:hypothetical protein